MHDHTEQDRQNVTGGDAHPPSFWKSRAGVYLIVALVLGGLLLGFEHRAHILASNWLLWLPLVLCVGMHFFMHGGHGGHGSGEDEK
ncbi:MAG: DUF2933 domain-containing protein [Rhodobiaceae bacterium]|nr:DUF2933 domain-containing protein [Rhodobiaceae bacterium]